MSFKVNHLHLKTPDPRTTAQWYVDYLGAKVVSERQSPSGQPILRLDLHGVPLNVTGYIEGQRLEQHYGLEHVAIDTDDFDAQVEKIKASGAKILEERSLPDGRRVCFFEGPDGVRLEFLEMR
ncbi:MAG: VOC family protein [Deltaproteobacteria bacterium]|jgi:catechol 2,3-dioxygenase-like lactoylglutathione lyase family enzyme|nr:VOC family protein [Deltaproteobacteria bacterium]MCZ6450258.1 VOC family protein [Deltaproteobacteria bacterium]MCZ6546865.1 VOC family protein [Deltaproteobacteria bacterium]MCZ6562669.1 VOC family protein [Deltaproteobacteria bacterium]MCZ6622231.1 VOC family protein [Deltaproteobacteria bacterium]